MSTITLTPKLHIHQPQPEQSHRVTLSGVLWIKILRWVDQATSTDAMKALRRTAVFSLLIFAIFAPQFLLGTLLASFQWNGGKIPLFCGLLLMTFNAKRSYLWLRRRAVRKRSANQHTYHGLPVSEFASFLLKSNGFKLADAEKLALSRNKYDAITEELDKAGITVKGKDNARLLRPISLEQLVTQLRDNFPLMWDEAHNEWTDKEDAYGRYLRAEGFKSRRLTEEVQKGERKLARIKKEIKKETEQYVHPIFARVAV